MKHLVPAALTLSLVLAACSNGPAPTPTPTPTPTPGDTTPPTILSTTPANAATGVAKDVNIVVTFSEAMDKAATQTAFQSADLGPSTFSWNAEGTVLTVNPNADLTYNTGATAKTYTYSFNSAAKDLAGNALADTSRTFRTLRRLTTNLTSTAALDGYVRSDGTVNTGCGTEICVGDSGLVDNAGYRGFTSFDLSALPADLAGTSVETAQLSLFQSALNGSPYNELCTSSGGPLILQTCLIVDSVNYGASLNAPDFEAPLLRQVGTTGLFDPKTAGTTLTFNALPALQDDLANRAARGNRSQYRLRFSRGTDGDGNADTLIVPSGAAAANKPTLAVTYLVP